VNFLEKNLKIGIIEIEIARINRSIVAYRTNFPRDDYDIET